MRFRDVALSSVLVPLACGDDPSPANDSGEAASNTNPTGESSGGSSSGGGTTAASATNADTSAGPSTTGESSSGGDGPKFDLGIPDDDVDTGRPGDVCHVQGDNAVGDCSMEAPADSFSPEVQW